MILRSVLLWLLLGTSAAMACGQPPAGPLQAGAADLSVVDPRLERVQRGEATVLATLVSLKNTSAACLEDVVIEVRYFGADKQLIDTATESFFDIVVPPGKTVAFRLDSVPLHPLSDYVAQEVSVISASPPRAAPAQRSGPGLIEHLLQWIPFLVFSTFLGFLLRWLRSKKSPQSRALELAAQQNILLQAQNTQLERIASALESHARSDKAET